jgi:hypothetical protein
MLQAAAYTDCCCNQCCPSGGGAQALPCFDVRHRPPIRKTLVVQVEGKGRENEPADGNTQGMSGLDGSLQTFLRCSAHLWQALAIVRIGCTMSYCNSSFLKHLGVESRLCCTDMLHLQQINVDNPRITSLTSQK